MTHLLFPLLLLMNYFMIMTTLILMVIVSCLCLIPLKYKPTPKQIMFENFRVGNCTIEPFLWTRLVMFCMSEEWTESFDWLSATSIVRDVKEDKIPWYLTQVIPTVVETKESQDTMSVGIIFESFNRSKDTEAINSTSVEPMLMHPRITLSVLTSIRAVETTWHIQELGMELQNVPSILRTTQPPFGSKRAILGDFLVSILARSPSLPRPTQSFSGLISTTVVLEKRVMISREPSNTTPSGSTVSVLSSYIFESLCNQKQHGVHFLAYSHLLFFSTMYSLSLVQTQNHTSLDPSKLENLYFSSFEKTLSSTSTAERTSTPESPEFAKWVSFSEKKRWTTTCLSLSGFLERIRVERKELPEKGSMMVKKDTSSLRAYQDYQNRRGT